ncbi:hypothetical protein QBZ16_004761 [Prototheca wickerhamii]|uniref:Cystatin domain-containing protein n=1 Tax=Prototheca wickerhamii TaxID=3111 RepID=A0AAD9IJB9_PROWI|nr:hypothetical protein QBZ16_004761 [Prototheca wickerhamii]
MGLLAGGFSSKPAGENDERVNKAVDVAKQEIKSKHSGSTTISVDSVETQVVAGTNYRLQLTASDGDSKTRYQATVFGKLNEALPHEGGNFKLTDIKSLKDLRKVSSSQFADDAAAYAVQQLSSQSNSLYPFSLKEILEAQEEKEGENTVHKLKLKVEHGTMPDQVFEVEVVDQPKGYQLRSSQQQR